MKFGPFTAVEVERIEQDLKPLGVSYEIEESDELRDQKLSSPKGASGRGTYFVEIDESVVTEHAAVLERHGIVATHEEPSFEDDDYVCAQCDHTSEAPGECPNHNTPLQTYTEFLAAKRVKDAKSQRVVFAILAAISMFLLIATQLRR